MDEKDYQNQEVKYISAMGSVAHTYGNLLATAQKYVLDIFPKNTFKTIRINSQIAHKQMVSTPYKFLKNTKPMIVFQPRMGYDDKDTFLANTLMTSRMGGPLTSKTAGDIELHPFLFDGDASLDMQYSESRRVMNLDVVMTFETRIQQINYREYLMGELQFDTPFDINTWLEAYLPRELLDMVATLSGIPIHDENGSVHDFLSYLNGHSTYPVTYKLAGSTGKEEFYRYYPTKILAKIDNLDSNQGDTVGQITNNYQISFSLRLEFWSPVTNYLFSRRISEVPKPQPPSDATMIPIYADIFALEDLDLPPGWQMHSYTSYILDKPEDSADFSTIIERSIIELLDYHRKNAMPFLNFFGVRVRRQGELLLEGKDYEIDYDNLVVHFHNKDYGWYTYSIIVVVDVAFINDELKEIFHLE